MTGRVKMGRPKKLIPPLPVRREFVDELRNDLQFLISKSGYSLKDIAGMMERRASWKKRSWERRQRPITPQYISLCLLGYNGENKGDGLMGLFRICEAIEVDVFPKLEHRPKEARRDAVSNGESNGSDEQGS